jgi:chromosome segregation ATPase
MGSDDLTVRVLIEIRDQIGGLRDEVGGLRTEVVETNKRVDAMDQHLGTEIVAMKTVLTDVATVMKGRRKLEARLDRCEREIDELKRKLG